MLDGHEINEAIKGFTQITCMAIVVVIITAAVGGFTAGKQSKGGKSMVKVSSDGPVKTKKVICSKCSYELEYTGEDVKTQSLFEMAEFSGISYYITCPRENCQAKNTVPFWGDK
jgi:hypothetical protein